MQIPTHQAHCTPPCLSERLQLPRRASRLLSETGLSEPAWQGHCTLYLAGCTVIIFMKGRSQVTYDPCQNWRTNDGEVLILPQEEEEDNDICSSQLG